MILKIFCSFRLFFVCFWKKKQKQTKFYESRFYKLYFFFVFLNSSHTLVVKQKWKKKSTFYFHSTWDVGLLVLRGLWLVILLKDLFYDAPNNQSVMMPCNELQFHCCCSFVATINAATLVDLSTWSIKCRMNNNTNQQHFTIKNL